MGIHVRDGDNPVMFATSCDVLNQVELPAGWDGWCLEYIDADEGRITGVFPYGVTSR
ncbi:hypothetical protein [Egicoccus sp. AB-alg6-2]|uniref:hypothetical protein n=1 Tax=Egicoccus sp. AB-alg6-2 TaxID=3242692 RepID=UPI00359EA5A4